MGNITNNYNIDAPGNIEREIRAWLIGYPVAELGTKFTSQETRENNVYGPGINARIFQFIMEGILDIIDRLIEPNKKEGGEVLTASYKIPETFREFLTEALFGGFGKEAGEEKQLSKDIEIKTKAFREAIRLVEVELTRKTINRFEPFIKQTKENAITTFKEILANKPRLKNPNQQILKFYGKVETDLETVDEYIIVEWGNAIKIASKQQNIHPQQNREREEMRRRLYTLPDGRDLRTGYGRP